MGFKKLRGVELSEEQQGLIRYTCLNHRSQPVRIQQKVYQLCDKCGGDYSAALQETMCSKQSILAIAQKYHVSESTLYHLRRNFYESW